MNNLQLQLIPLRPVVCSDYASELDLIVRVLLPTGGLPVERERLNLGFVLDCSGSVTTTNISLYHQVIQGVLKHLLPSDRISITVFNDLARVAVANTWVLDKHKVLSEIAEIKPTGSSALYAGWMAGAMQVGQYYQSDTWNRVIVLSDGNANEGETNANTIALDVNGLARRGVSTSTVGIGSKVNTDLLQAIARAGRGHYHRLKTSKSINALCKRELTTLLPTVGINVSLQVIPEDFIEILDNSSVPLPSQPGCYPLANLVVGNPQELLLRLKVPPLAQTQRLCRFRLIWTPPNAASAQTLEAELELPAVSFNQLEEFSINPQVQRRVVRMMGVRAQVERAMSGVL